MSDITITLHDPSTGRSESMPVSPSLTVQEVLDLGKALLGIDDESSNNTNGKLVVSRYGKALNPPTKSLSEAGVASGDLLALVRMRPAPAARSAAISGGLDFSNLLGGGAASTTASSGAGGLDFSSLLGGSMNTTIPPKQPSTTPVYYPGMSFEEAMESNPHPQAIVGLLQKHTHLFKEFNYHMVRP